MAGKSVISIKAVNFWQIILHMHVCFIIWFFILYSYQLYNRDLRRKLQNESGSHNLSWRQKLFLLHIIWYCKSCLNWKLFETFNNYVWLCTMNKITLCIKHVKQNIGLSSFQSWMCINKKNSSFRNLSNEIFEMVVKACFQGGPIFLLFCFAPIFPFSFLKMPYIPFFFKLKLSFTW